MRNLPQKTQTLVIQIQHIPSPDFNCGRATPACIVITQDHWGGIRVGTLSRLIVPSLLVSSRPYLGDFVQLRSGPWNQASAVAKDRDNADLDGQFFKGRREYLISGKRFQPTIHFTPDMLFRRKIDGGCYTLLRYILSVVTYCNMAHYYVHYYYYYSVIMTLLLLIITFNVLCYYVLL